MALAYRLSPTSIFRVTAAVESPRRNLYPRIVALDVMRGMGMVFVCLSHFAAVYLSPQRIGIASLLTTVSMIASPAFMIASGMTTGCLAVMHPRDMPRLRRVNLDRGVFLLVVGHAVLAGALLGTHSIGSAYTMGFITDTIAIAIIVGPRVVGRLSSRSRLIVACALYFVSWLVVAGWEPANTPLTLAKRFAVGELPALPHTAQPPMFPVFPWFAVYLLGTVLGEHFGFFLRSTREDLARRLLVRTGAAAMLGGLVLYLAARNAAALGLTPSSAEALNQLTSPTYKTPPGLAYLLYFGGCGLIVLWLLLQLEARGRARQLLGVLRRFGQASLPIFLLQEYLYFMLLRWWALPYTSVWPVLYLASLTPLIAIAVMWCRVDGNRFLTVGLLRLIEWRTARRRRNRGPFIVARLSGG